MGLTLNGGLKVPGVTFADLRKNVTGQGYGVLSET